MNFIHINYIVRQEIILKFIEFIGYFQKTEINQNIFN